jgi:two-component system cell cycle sensor histidine kinase/response regulator CckA
MNEPIPPSTPTRPDSPQPWILVVDDEPSMRTLIGIILRAEGWKVITADGAEAAIESLRANARPPAVVVCDVLMKGTDGLELARRMCARIPDLNVIFISGRLSDVSWWPTDLREHRFLAKPFEKVQLVAAVRDAMDAKGSRN